MVNNILVWGLGWLGMPLAKNLLKNENNVYCITRSYDKKELLNSNFLNAFTLDKLPDFSNSIKKCDVFILTVPPINDLSFFEQLSFILSHLPEYCQLIYTSSTGVYININGEVSENSELDKSNKSYQIEEFLQEKRSQNLTILRLGGLIGPKRHPVHFLAKKSVNLNPSQVVNLVQQIDVITIVGLVVEFKQSGIFNICSHEHPTRKVYYNSASTEFGLGSLIFEMDEHQSGKIVDSKKISELFLNFTFSSIYDFEKCK
jgi:nucleoside-diphosphate-sugar epimerase